MIYVPSFQLLFTHISRTGGTTLTNCLHEAIPFPGVQKVLDQHSPLVAARPILGDKFESTFKFAIVRNPWDRLLSWYTLLAKATNTEYHDPTAEYWKGFDAFLEDWASQEVIIDGVVRRRLSQWAQLADANGQLLTDDIGRFEHLATDIRRLFAKIGIQCSTLPKLNASHRHHYSVYYSDFGRDLVRDIFSEDVVVFGYGFEEE